MGRIPEHVKIAIEKMCEQLADEAVSLYESGVLGETVEDQLYYALESLCAENEVTEDKNYVYRKTTLQ